MQQTYEELLKIMEPLQKENDILKKEIVVLKKENKKEDNEIKKLQKELIRIVDSVKHLQDENRKLRNELRKYVNENTPSGAIPSYMKKKLEEVVNEYSRTPDEENKERKENRRNARSKRIDRKEYHSEDKPCCPNCGSAGRRRGKSTRKRIVIHLQLPKFDNVEHENEIYQCNDCGKIFDAQIPNVLPNSEFDIVTTVLISYLSTATNMTIGNIAALFGSFGLDISEGSITNALKRLKRYLGPYHNELLERVKAANARYKDETSHRHNGENFWTWVIATKEWVYYTIERRRSHKIAEKLASDHGTDIVDGYAGYNGLSSIQRDWSHSLRRAKKPIYNFGADENYNKYKSFVKELSLLFHDAKIAKTEKGVSKKLRNEYDCKLWKLLKTAPTKGKNFIRLINYIMKFDGEWFTFLEYKDVDPTSDLAERSLRHVVVKRKVSQQTRGQDSMDSYAMQVSLYMTSKIRGENYMKSLSNIIKSDVLSTPYKS